MTLTLNSDKPNTVRVSPASVFIPAGAVGPPSPPQLTGVNIGAATITASASGYTPASQAVAVPATDQFLTRISKYQERHVSEALTGALRFRAMGTRRKLMGRGRGRPSSNEFFQSKRRRGACDRRNVSGR